MLRSLLDYAQESGHIKRDRLANEAIIVIDLRGRNNNSPVRAIPGLVERFIGGDKC